MMRWIMNVVTVALLASMAESVLAEPMCSESQGQGVVQEKTCQHPQWRDQAAMQDDSDVRLTKRADNVEYHLPKAKVTVWALPPVPVRQSTIYRDDEFKPVRLKVTSSPQFQSASATLSPAGIHSVAALINTLKNKQHIRLKVIGHTDNQPISVKTQRWFKDNQALSLARAKAVARYFQQKLKLPDSAITVLGKGATQPIARNDTPSGMAKNRRVEILIWYDEPVPGKAETIQIPLMHRQWICQGKPADTGLAGSGFAISVDGQPLDQQEKDGENQQRCTDVALDKTHIHVQYDNLSDRPMLDVSAWPATAVAGETLHFQAYSNYLAWIDHAEVRIFSEKPSPSTQPLATIALDKALSGEWVVPQRAPQKMMYRLRVYDRTGRFDETDALPLWHVASHKRLEDEDIAPAQSNQIAYGKTRLSQQTIPISGGSVTVSGDAIPAHYQVVVMGQSVPIDQQGHFVIRQIIPAGRHTIEVAVLDTAGNGALYRRDIELKKQDWFYVGFADVTAGRYRSHGAAQTVTQDRQHLGNQSFVDGRLAFYTKGKWHEKYTITASADTREQPLKDIASTLMKKDPRSLLRRLGDSEYYPTFGDDSTLVEDAPTQGKFFAKIEDGRSQAMWGNFKIVQQETDLAQINRGLYGAVADWNSQKTTSDSESQTHVNVFAAEPGTQAAREEFRATGGTLFYLRHQDIVTGSERVQVEVRDKDSGIVLSVNTLVAGQDYQEDAVQGRIALTRPLPASSDDSALVRAGNYIGHPVYLVVYYEYVGQTARFDDLAIGGRATHWVNDSLRLGLTHSRQQQGSQDHNLDGLDAVWRKTPDTYVRLEAARSEGPDVTSHQSWDGGFTFLPSAGAINNAHSANAYQLESGFKLTDLGATTAGTGYLYARRRGAGFSAPGQQTRYTTKQWGGKLSMPLSERDSVDIKMDLNHQSGGVDSDNAELDYLHELTKHWSLSTGLRTDRRRSGTNLTTLNTGQRTDLALQADYRHDEDWHLYGFAQGTLKRTQQRSANHRLGLGGAARINDRLGLKGEVSSGVRGLGALVGTDYRLSERTTTYLNYALDPDNANQGIGNRQGKLVTGARTRYSDWVSVYGEEQYLHGDRGQGLTHAYGVSLTPSESWKWGLALEAGQLKPKYSSAIQRRGITMTVDYGKNRVKYGGSLELRHDRINHLTRKTLYTRNHWVYQFNSDWRLRGALDVALSDSQRGDFQDANFIEAILGYAYRPVANDKLNLLLEYKYLSDQAPADQFTATGLQNKFEQRSHVFAIDGIYDLTPRWSLGAKYALRKGQLRAGRGSGDWFDSTAQLGVLRLDWHVVQHWDALVEGRVLDVREAKDTRSGLLLAVYRHLGDHVKAGLGYNFTDFSDDLTALNYDSRGLFVNIIGKW